MFMSHKKKIVGTSYSGDMKQPMYFKLQAIKAGWWPGNKASGFMHVYTFKKICAHQGTLNILKCHHGECHLDPNL